MQRKRWGASALSRRFVAEGHRLIDAPPAAERWQAGGHLPAPSADQPAKSGRELPTQDTEVPWSTGRWGSGSGFLEHELSWERGRKPGAEHFGVVVLASSMEVGGERDDADGRDR